MPKTILMCVAGVMLLTGGSAVAAEEPPQKTIRFADADLNDAVQAKQALKQIRTAAREVCAEGLSSPNGWVITDAQCERTAVREAVLKVGHPGLSRVATEAGDVRRDGLSPILGQWAEK